MANIQTEPPLPEHVDHIQPNEKQPKHLMVGVLDARHVLFRTQHASNMSTDDWQLPHAPKHEPEARSFDLKDDSPRIVARFVTPTRASPTPPLQRTLRGLVRGARGLVGNDLGGVDSTRRLDATRNGDRDGGRDFNRRYGRADHVCDVYRNLEHGAPRAQGLAVNKRAIGECATEQLGPTCIL